VLNGGHHRLTGLCRDLITALNCIFCTLAVSTLTYSFVELTDRIQCQYACIIMYLQNSTLSDTAALPSPLAVLFHLKRTGCNMYNVSQVDVDYILQSELADIVKQFFELTLTLSCLVVQVFPQHCDYRFKLHSMS